MCIRDSSHSDVGTISVSTLTSFFSFSSPHENKKTRHKHINNNVIRLILNLRFILYYFKINSADEIPYLSPVSDNKSH